MSTGTQVGQALADPVIAAPIAARAGIANGRRTGRIMSEIACGGDRGCAKSRLVRHCDFDRVAGVARHTQPDDVVRCRFARFLFRNFKFDRLTEADVAAIEEIFSKDAGTVAAEACRCAVGI